MARIRTLKPEFWDSPSTAQADLAVRLTFMAMWNWADDSGHGVGNLKEIEAFAFPNDEVAELPRRTSGNSAGTCGGWRNFAEICGEVQECYGVVFYKVKGRPYYWIPSFKGHQSRDFNPKSRYPTHEEGEIFDIDPANADRRSNNAQYIDPGVYEASAGSSGNSADTSGDSALGTGEQGNRGTGEQGKNTSSATQPDSPEFDAFWSAFPSERKSNKPGCRKKFAQAAKTVDPQKIIAAAAAYRDDPNREAKYTVNPHKWLNEERWESGPLPAANVSASDQRLQRGFQLVQQAGQREMIPDAFPDQIDTTPRKELGA